MIRGKLNLTKADLIGEIASRTGHSKTEVKTISENLFQVIRESIANGMSVQVRGFGSFYAKHKASKKARNISKGTTIEIPAHDVPAFKPAKDFQNSLK